ncbi:MAG TPA: hypothetical protein VFX02_10525 [Gammaproteobacteria bacterium]|nr:hypothetical protein [Gammaproteobacteria bacterium]
MTKQTAGISAVLILSGAALGYLFYSNIRLREELAMAQRQCQNRIARVQSDYQGELQELQQYLLAQTSAAAPGAAPPAAVMAGPRDDSDAPDAFKKPALERYNESMEDLVARKYRFLLTSATLSEADREALQQLLVERERLALSLRDIREYGEAGSGAQPEDIELRLAEIDDRIQELLNPQDYQRYGLLKESDKEQHHFTEFTLGVNGIFPLNNGQQEAVLFAKIRHEKDFETNLKDLGLYADDPLNAQQRDHLYGAVQSAAETYRRGFLQEIKQYLDASSFPFDQYTLVENYTNTEFQQLLDDLRGKIDARAAQN